MKQQIIIIHGGDTFETYEEYLKFLNEFEVDLVGMIQKRWKNGLQAILGDNFEVIQLQMPNKINAKYLEWKIWFEKFIPYFHDDLILLGHSLGAIFLAKYLSENTLPLKIAATLLVASPFDEQDSEYKLDDFNLPESLVRFDQQGGVIVLYHSKDDSVVPYVDLAKYHLALPSATIRSFDDRDHFGQAEFPEIVNDIQALHSMQKLK